MYISEPFYSDDILKISPIAQVLSCRILSATAYYVKISLQLVLKHLIKPFQMFPDTDDIFRIFLPQKQSQHQTADTACLHSFQYCFI